MKTFILIVTGFVVFMFFYFMLSLVGLLFFPSYEEIICSRHWFTVYTMSFGSWTTLLVMDELAQQMDN